MSYNLMSGTQTICKIYKDIVKKSIQVVVLEPKRFDRGSHRVTHFSQPNPSSNTIFFNYIT